MRVLPAGWRVVPLNDLQSSAPRAITDGPFGSNLTRAHYTPEGARVVRLQNIGDGVFRDAKAFIPMKHYAALSNHNVESGDLLVASLGEELPRACLAPQWLGPAIVKADCIRVRLHESVDPRYVMYALQAPATRRWAAKHLHGVGRPRLGLKVIREIPIPLPRQEEQRRIVELLEDHLSRLDAADKYLVTARARLGTVPWSLLRSHPSLREVESVPLGKVLATPLANGRSVPTRVGGFPVLRLTALKSGAIDLRERKAGDWSAADAKPYLVEQGDFLVSRGNGSLSLVARGGLVTEAPDAVAYPDTLIRVRTDRSKVDPDYLALLWNSPVVRRQVESMARTTAGIYKVNQEHLRSVTLPLPALPVQRQLAQEITMQFESSTRLEADIDVVQTRSVALRRVLLEAAFTGRLTCSARDEDVTEELAEA